MEVVNINFVFRTPNWNHEICSISEPHNANICWSWSFTKFIHVRVYILLLYSQVFTNLNNFKEITATFKYGNMGCPRPVLSITGIPFHMRVRPRGHKYMWIFMHTHHLADVRKRTVKFGCSQWRIKASTQLSNYTFRAWVRASVHSGPPNLRNSSVRPNMAYL